MKAREMSMRPYRREAMLEALAEVLLSCLPMVLVLITLLHLEKVEKIFQKPEWAFAAAIFFSQAIVRLVSATAHRHNNLRAGFLALVVVLLVLLGLGPSCAIVVIVLFVNDAEPGEPAVFSMLLQALQVGLYIVSTIAFVLVAVIARELESDHKHSSESSSDAPSREHLDLDDIKANLP